MSPGTMTAHQKGLDAASLKGKTNTNQPFEWTLGRDGNTRVAAAASPMAAAR